MFDEGLFIFLIQWGWLVVLLGIFGLFFLLVLGLRG